MSSYNRFSHSLLRPGLAQTLGGVAVGAATVLLVQRWFAARARVKAAAAPQAAVVEPAASLPPPAPRARVRKRAKRA